MTKPDRNTLNLAIDEIQKLMDENLHLDNVDQEMGYKLALLKIQNRLYSIRLEVY